jgi:dUTP pyrophosphatase
MSDVLVVYWPAGVESVGVGIEIAHAANQNKPIVLIRGDGTVPLSLRPYDIIMVSEPAMEDGSTLRTAILDALIAANNAKHSTTASSMIARYDGDGAQPEAALPGDAGFDIAYHGNEDIVIRPGEKANIPSGIAYQMPPGYWSLILGRSSTFSKRGLLVPPSVIDAGYTGPIFAICWNVGQTDEIIKPGDRLAQIIPMPLSAEFMNWRKAPLDQTARGSNGFGSTGA